MKLAAVVVALAACSHGAPAGPPPPSEPLPSSPLHGFMLPATRLITAVADDWSSTKVTISVWTDRHLMLDRQVKVETGEREWQRDGEPFEAVIGRGGLAWGSGLHGVGAPDRHDGPIKQEGDARAPAGAFAIKSTFGFASTQGRRFYYRRFIQLDDQTECVDDPKSAAYNTIAEHTGSADWTSSEHMRTVTQYELGAVIDHNPARTPGAGSCIFLHVWDGPDSTTVGCTAMPKDRLEELLAGLDDHTVFVQLPRAEYQALQAEWGLPTQ